MHLTKGKIISQQTDSMIREMMVKSNSTMEMFNILIEKLHQINLPRDEERKELINYESEFGQFPPLNRKFPMASPRCCRLRKFRPDRRRPSSRIETPCS
jgi:hypothetical protein